MHNIIGQAGGWEAAGACTLCDLQESRTWFLGPLSDVPTTLDPVSNVSSTASQEGRRKEGREGEEHAVTRANGRGTGYWEWHAYLGGDLCTTGVCRTSEGRGRGGLRWVELVTVPKVVRERRAGQGRQAGSRS